jgi:hypothetical protein
VELPLNPPICFHGFDRDNLSFTLTDGECSEIINDTMDETRSVKKFFEGKLEGRRGRVRPRLRWINDVEDDLKKLGVKRCRTKALDRVEWASIIREAKAKLKGP